MKGRKPLPTHLKILQGNPGKQKLPKGEPEPPLDMPDPPSHLDEYALEEWRRLAPGLNALGILSSIDGGPFGAYCMAHSLWRKAEEELNEVQRKGGPLAALLIQRNGEMVPNPLVRISRQAAADMVRYATEFGLTPSSRARLAIGPGRGKPSKFSGLIGVPKTKL